MINATPIKTIIRIIGILVPNLMKNFIKTGAIAPPIPSITNKIVTRISLPLSYMVLPVDTKIGSIPEQLNPPITKKVKMIFLLLKKIIKIIEIKAKEEITIIKTFCFILPIIKLRIILPIKLVI